MIIPHHSIEGHVASAISPLARERDREKEAEKERAGRRGIPVLG